MSPAAKIPVATPAMQQYFKAIMDAVDRAYEIAKKARAQALDPDVHVEIHKAVDVAERVEALVGPKGIAVRIRELEETLEREDVAFKIAEEIIHGRFGSYDSESAADIAVRAALAILTEGITAGPLEGIARVEIKQNADQSPYLAVYYAGPIRAAGGTEAAVTVLIADYVRRLLNLNRFLPSERHVERYVEEVELYERRVMHLQIPTTSDQIRFAAQSIPIEITGEPTTEVEVSGYRDVEGVETNRIRGGAILVLNDGVVGRAAKLLRIVDKISLQGWDWLKKIKALSNPSTTGKEGDNLEPETKGQGLAEDRDTIGCSPRISPDWKYIADIIGGRPVFSYPMRRGGFRLRYGRSRNTGLAAVGIHPATMYVLDEFIAPGTHIRTERPGKGAIVMPVTSIEGPIVLLNSGEVIQITTVDQARKLSPLIHRILYNGDIIAGFGEFIENNHPLVPTGYCEEQWAAELQQTYKSFQTFLEEAGIPNERITHLIASPFTAKPTLDEAFMIARATGIGLHPKYLPFWDTLSVKELTILHTTLISHYNELKPEQLLPNQRSKIKIIAPKTIKAILERLGFPHTVHGSEPVLSGEKAYLLGRTLGLIPAAPRFASIPPADPFIEPENPVLQQLTQWAQVPIRGKGLFFIGARMGRPEKAKERVMKPLVHALYPVGLAGGNTRNIVNAIKKPPPEVALTNRTCPKCNSSTPYLTCPKCGAGTTLIRICPQCGRRTTLENCPNDHTPTQVFSKYPSQLSQDWQIAMKNLKRNPPRRVKGVIGMMSAFKTPERLEKGILRAIHGLSVFKDGTIRFDSTDAPLTHFRPDEINVPILRLKQLGYTHDIQGKTLEKADQVLELKPQDIVITESAADYLVNVATFIDDLLTDFYNLDAYYRIDNKQSLVGHLVIGISPHTSAGIIGRIIGFTKAKVGFAHPYWHAAKRRNCLAENEIITLYNTQTHEITINPIKTIVERFLKESTDIEVVDDFGTISIPNSNHHLRVISINPDTLQPILQPIKNWIKASNHHWITIHTATGRSLSITPDHHTLTWDPESKSIRKTYAHQLKPGNIIPLLSKLPLPIQKPPKHVNILQELSDHLPNNFKFKQAKNDICLTSSSKWIKKKLYMYIERNLGIPINTKNEKKLASLLRKHLSLPYINNGYPPFSVEWYHSIPLSHLEILYEKDVFRWNDIPNDARLSTVHDDTTIKNYIPFTTDLLRLIGYYVAKDCFCDSCGHLEATSSKPDPSVSKHINALTASLLGVLPYKDKGSPHYSIPSRIYCYLIAYAWNAGLDTHTKHIPSFVYTLPYEYRFAFLSAYIDLSGSLSCKDKSLSLYCSSKAMLYELGALLNSLGVHYNIRRRPVGCPDKIEAKRHNGAHVNFSQDEIMIKGPDLKLLRKLTLFSTTKKQRSKQILSMKLGQRFKVVDNFNAIFELQSENNVLFDVITDVKISRKNANAYCFEIGLPAKKNKEKLYHNFYANSIISMQCDGDEDSYILLMDGLLNFSKFFLPSTRGGTMDAPLVLSVVLNPAEVDDEVHSMDIGDKYALEIYQGGRDYRDAKALAKHVSLVADRLGLDTQYEGFKFTHPTERFDVGPLETVYKTLGAMVEKTERQLALCRKIDAVDVKDVARRVLEGHYLPDIIGNLRKYGQQGFRCVKCNAGYRRPPLSGVCLKCGGRLILKVSEGNVLKYLEIARRLTEEYELGEYLQQRLELLNQSIAGLFKGEPDKQVQLSDFL
ncbi:MAG: DNA polymerase II large subunit [Candidatus Ranarchaeia archaeon]